MVRVTERSGEADRGGRRAISTIALLEDHGPTYTAFQLVQTTSCVRCDGLGIRFLDTHRCFCIHCDHQWDAINVRAPAVIAYQDPS